MGNGLGVCFVGVLWWTLRVFVCGWAVARGVLPSTGHVGLLCNYSSVPRGAARHVFACCAVYSVIESGFVGYLCYGVQVVCMGVAVLCDCSLVWRVARVQFPLGVWRLWGRMEPHGRLGMYVCMYLSI